MLPCLRAVTWLSFTASLVISLWTNSAGFVAARPSHQLKEIRLLGSDSQTFDLGSHAPRNLKLFVNLVKDKDLLDKVKRLHLDFHTHGLRVIGIASPEDAVDVERALAQGDGDGPEEDKVSANERVRVVQRGKEESWKLTEWLSNFHSAVSDEAFQSFLVDQTGNFVSRFSAEDLENAFKTGRNEPTMVQELTHLAKFHGHWRREL